MKVAVVFDENFFLMKVVLELVLYPGFPKGYFNPVLPFPRVHDFGIHCIDRFPDHISLGEFFLEPLPLAPPMVSSWTLWGSQGSVMEQIRRVTQQMKMKHRAKSGKEGVTKPQSQSEN